MTKVSCLLNAWVATSAFSGFLFGFDTAVISGAEQAIQAEWGLGGAMQGLVTSSALWGTVLSALIGSVPVDRFGRQRVLLWVGFLFILSAIGSAFALGPLALTVARFLGGLGVGLSCCSAPVYIAEIVPADKRGTLGAMFQLNIVLGTIGAYASNYALALYVDASVAWRYMLGIMVLPSTFYTIACLGIPESPRWLVMQRQLANAEKVLRQSYTDFSESEVSSWVALVEASLDAERISNQSYIGILFSRTYCRPTMLAVLIAVFNQFSGCNVVNYFAPRIFSLSGFGGSASLIATIGIGVINLVFTMLGASMIDRFGRKTLLLIGNVGYILSLLAVTWAFSVHSFGMLPVYLCAFIAAHAIGQGTVIWVFISELFLDRYRATGLTVGAFTHWFCAAFLTQSFPLVVEVVEPACIFGFFCLVTMAQLLWVICLVPETKGVPVEDMEKLLLG